MNADIKMKFNNNYHLELIDSLTGNIKQSGDFHNIATTPFLRILTSRYSTSENFDSESAVGYDTNYSCIFYCLLVGSGSREPAKSDTALQNQLWKVGNEGITAEWIDDYTLRGESSYTFPATSSYVGEIREVGLTGFYYRNYQSYGADGPAYTRALLTDSEGQPISFNKTDTDILKVSVTVEASIVCETASFKIFKKPFILERIIKKNDSDLSIFYSDLSLNRFTYELPFDRRSIPNMDIRDQEITDVIYANAKLGESYIKYPTSRLSSTTVTSETYFKAIVIPAIGFWELPNEDLFPAYTISNISIGTGDGETVIFKNPLCYFKEGTDRVYKNGELLTRDVDYTINHIGNHAGLPEIYTEVPTKIYSTVTMSVPDIAFTPFLPTYLPIPNITEQKGFTNFFHANHPLYVEYEHEMTFNYLNCNEGLCALNADGNSSSTAGIMIYLDYSTDGVDYIEVASASVKDRAFKMNFPDTTAKYWRLRTNYSNANYVIGLSNTANSINYILPGRKDPDIVFAVPPAVGDLITMDVDMDVIMKNSNYVVDISCQVNFKI